MDDVPAGISSSRAHKRRRKQNPLYRALKLRLGGDALAAQVATALFQAGVTTPEELRRTHYGKLAVLPGISRSGRARLGQIHGDLRKVEQATDPRKQ